MESAVWFEEPLWWLAELWKGVDQSADRFTRLIVVRDAFNGRRFQWRPLWTAMRPAARAHWSYPFLEVFPDVSHIDLQGVRLSSGWKLLSRSVICFGLDESVRERKRKAEVLFALRSVRWWFCHLSGRMPFVVLKMLPERQTTLYTHAGVGRQHGIPLVWD